MEELFAKVKDTGRQRAMETPKEGMYEYSLGKSNRLKVVSLELCFPGIFPVASLTCPSGERLNHVLVFDVDIEVNILSLTTLLSRARGEFCYCHAMPFS